MIRMFRAVLFLAVLAVPMLAHADDMASLPSGVRGELIMNMRDAAGKVEELAGAVPDAKYAWRPAKGVRSIGEVYLHIAGANLMIPTALGVSGGLSFEDGEKYDQKKMSKAETIQALKDSYAFAEKAITDMSDADLEQQIDMFGHKMSKRAVLILLVAHSHEHLGQSIAYARTNGIVPPWTAREMAKAAEKKGDDAHKH